MLESSSHYFPHSCCCFRFSNIAYGLMAFWLFWHTIAAHYTFAHVPFEWWYAVAEGGDAGIEFPGSQGDVRDAQKDMLADTLAAIFSLLIYHITRPDLHHNR
nr:DUF2238 domain-containing protein [Mariprofundus sp. KV]